MKKIAFIDVGVMGKSMIRNLNKAGYHTTIFTRTKSEVGNLINGGIYWSNTTKECVQNKDIIMTTVGYPKDVKEIYYGNHEIPENAKENAICIDFTTSIPALAQKIYTDARMRNIKSLDAPVSGGDIGTKNGILSTMVGGD